jgi:hypothetical protein
MSKEEAEKCVGMLGPKGSQARGYMQGLKGEDPNAKNESDPNGYEEAWLRGAEERAS